MSTNTQNFDPRYGALTVFYDHVSDDEEEKSQFDLFMSEIYNKSEEYMYQSVTSIPDINDFNKALKERMSKAQTFLPPDKKLVMAYYVKPEDLTDEWVDRFFELALILKKKLGALDDPSKQRHVIILRHIVDSIDDEERTRLVKVIHRLMNEEITVVKDFYLLRKDFLDSFKAQEHGVANLLFLLSRRSNTELVGRINSSGNVLRMVTYDDFYENRAIKCQNNIAAIEDWMNNKVDPGQENLKKLVIKNVIESREDLRGKLRELRMKASIYPVSINDYSRTLLGKYKCNIEGTHPMILEQRKEFVQKFEERIMHNIDLTAIEDFIKGEYHYPDFIELLSLIQNEKLSTELMANVDGSSNDEKEFVNKIVAHLCKKIVAIVESVDLKSEKAVKEKKRISCRLEAVEAGAYEDAEDCLNRIDTRIDAPVIKGIVGSKEFVHALISGSMTKKVLTQGYDINGINNAYIYSEVEPYELVLVKMYSMCYFDQPDSLNVLEKVFD